MDAEMQAFAVALGPRLRWRPTEKLSLVAQAGVTLNLLDADLERTETFAWEGGETIGTWRDAEDAQEWLWGAGIAAGARYDLTDALHLAVLAGYDWVEKANFEVGPDRIEADLSGWRAEAALGCSFGR